MGLLALDHTRLRFGGIVALDVVTLEVVDDASLPRAASLAQRSAFFGSGSSM
jgi:hypothetical protein